MVVKRDRAHKVCSNQPECNYPHFHKSYLPWTAQTIIFINRYLDSLQSISSVL